MKFQERVSTVVVACVMMIPLEGSTAFAQTTGHKAVPMPCRTGPLVKNLTSLNTPPCDPTDVHPQRFTRKQLEKMSRQATTAEDHTSLARYYSTEADRMTAEAAGYEEAAALHRTGPVVKNLTSPGTSQRYTYIADNLRKEADRLRQGALREEAAATTHATTVAGVK